MKLVNTVDSKSTGFTALPVQVRPSVPTAKKRSRILGRFFYVCATNTRAPATIAHQSAFQLTTVSRLRQKKLFPKLIFAVFAAVVFIASYYLGNQYARPLVSQTRATLLPTPKIMAGFELSDKYGEPFTTKSFKDFWNFVMVGNLQDSGCDSLLRLYVMAWNQLAAKPELQKKTRVVFVDDSQPNKTPAQLRKHIDFYNPMFTAATGKQEQLDNLGEQIGIFANTRSCSPGNSVVALVNPEGYLLALFTGITDPITIAADLQYFIN